MFKIKYLHRINHWTGITTVVATPRLMVVHRSLPARRENVAKAPNMKAE